MAFQLKQEGFRLKVGKVAKNRFNRRFSTPNPLQKLVTDMTEFKCLGEEKLYLNPILDLIMEKLLHMESKNAQQP